MSKKTATVLSATLSAAAALVLLVPTQAVAKPDPGDDLAGAAAAAQIRLVAWPDDPSCLLRRVGRELVRCDDATGAGTAARRHVPGLEPGGSSVH